MLERGEGIAAQAALSRVSRYVEANCRDSMPTRGLMSHYILRALREFQSILGAVLGVVRVFIALESSERFFSIGVVPRARTRGMSSGKCS